MIQIMSHIESRKALQLVLIIGRNYLNDKMLYLGRQPMYEPSWTVENQGNLNPLSSFRPFLTGWI